jgi:hypothetical protein
MTPRHGVHDDSRQRSGLVLKGRNIQGVTQWRVFIPDKKKKAQLSYATAETFTNSHVAIPSYACEVLHLLQRRPSIAQSSLGSPQLPFLNGLAKSVPLDGRTVAYVLPTCRHEMHRHGCAFLFYSMISTFYYGYSVIDGSHFRSC